MMCSVFFWQGCGSISVINRPKEEIYSAEFLAKINEIKEIYKGGNLELARQKLLSLKEETLIPVERAKRRTLLGVILYSQKNYEQAIFNFNLAVPDSIQDLELTASIYLNLASSYYKIGFVQQAYDSLSLANEQNLKRPELSKFYKLEIKLTDELGKEREKTLALINYLSDKKNSTELKSEHFFDQLMGSFFKLETSQKLNIFNDFGDKNYFVVGYLAFLQVEKFYYSSQKQDARNLLDWIEDRYGSTAELKNLVSSFKFKIENYAKMNPSAIGVVLPLSGDKQLLGKRSLIGIDSKIKQLGAKGQRYSLYIEDSRGEPSVGAHIVKKLIDAYQVSVIVGGLFSDEATDEYLEAKKHGVLFVSLSQIYLPKEQKDHLLIEIPGSVESQIKRLFTDDVLNTFGRRAAIVYPKGNRGKAYIDEFWRVAKEKGVAVNGVLEYSKELTDYREPIKGLLGLKYPRERQEEEDLLKEIYELEGHRSTRRLQILRPDISFDWVFVPAFPNEALQILPSFNYLDAFNMNLIGGPSWRSQSLAKESFKLGKLYMIGDSVEKINSEFFDSFYNLYKLKPKLIEVRAFNSLEIVHSILNKNSFVSRDDLDIYLKSKKELSGITGKWFLSDGVWMKELVPLKLRAGRIENVDLSLYSEGGIKEKP